MRTPRYTYGVRETFPDGSTRMLCSGVAMGIARDEYRRCIASGKSLRSGNVCIVWLADGPHIYEVFRDSRCLPGEVA